MTDRAPDSPRRAGGFTRKSRRFRRYTANVVLVLASTLGSLGVAEMFLRSVFPPPGSSRFQHRIPDPDFGWRLEPDVSYRYDMPEKSIDIRYNSDGWRDTERAVAKPLGKFRIALLGDSFMEAYSVSLADAFHRQLAAKAAAARSEIEVLNFGVGGYSTLQELLVFERIAYSYKPDLVLLAVYLGNDVRNNSRELESYLHSVDSKLTSRPFLTTTTDDSWLITQVDYPLAVSRFVAARERRQTLSRQLYERFAVLRAVHAASRPLVRVLAAVRNERSLVPTQAQIERRQERNLAQFGLYYCELPDQFELAWNKTRRIIARLDAVVKASGSRLFVFTVPGLFEIDPEQLKRTSEPNRICWDTMPPYSRLAAELDSLGIPYVDLLPKFRQESQGIGAKLFRNSNGDRHWNEAGHAVAAEQVFEALRAAQLLPASL